MSFCSGLQKDLVCGVGRFLFVAPLMAVGVVRLLLGFPCLRRSSAALTTECFGICITSTSGTPAPALLLGAVCSHHPMAPKAMRKRTHRMKKDPAGFWCRVEEVSVYSGVCGSSEMTLMFCSLDQRVSGRLLLELSDVDPVS